MKAFNLGLLAAQSRLARARSGLDKVMLLAMSNVFGDRRSTNG